MTATASAPWCNVPTPGPCPTRLDLSKLIGVYAEAHRLAGKSKAKSTVAEAEALTAALDLLYGRLDQVERDCVTLAKLAADTPQFDNPLVAWEAQVTRDKYLAEATR